MKSKEGKIWLIIIGIIGIIEILSICILSNRYDKCISGTILIIFLIFIANKGIQNNNLNNNKT